MLCCEASATEAFLRVYLVLCCEASTTTDTFLRVYLVSCCEEPTTDTPSAGLPSSPLASYCEASATDTLSQINSILLWLIG